MTLCIACGATIPDDYAPPTGANYRMRCHECSTGIKPLTAQDIVELRARSAHPAEKTRWKAQDTAGTAEASG